MQDHDGITIRDFIPSTLQGIFRREPDEMSDENKQGPDDQRYSGNYRRSTNRSARDASHIENQSTASTGSTIAACEATGEPHSERKDARRPRKIQDVHRDDGERSGAGKKSQQLPCPGCDECSGKAHPKISPEQSTEQHKEDPYDEMYGEKPTGGSSGAPNSERKNQGSTLKHNRKQITDRYSGSREAALEKELKRWQGGYKELEGHCEGLEDNYKKLDSTKNQLEAKCKQLESICLRLRKTQEEENAKAILAVEERTSERDHLKSKLLELQAQHVRSVNSVGTGLEHISDQTFKDKFRTQHDKVGDWCRKAFKRKGQIRRLEEIDDLSIKDFLASRVRDINVMSVGNLMDTVVWGYIEKNILSAWFPAMLSENLRHISALEDEIRIGDTSTTLEKAEFWRAYTASLLFQNHQFQAKLEDVDPQSSDLYEIFSKVLRDYPSVSSNYMMALQDILHSVMYLAARLRCQRGVYEVDESVQLGDPYNDETMVDIKDPDVEDHATVSCIISRGLVKRPYKGATDVEELICKARVLVTVKRN